MTWSIRVAEAPEVWPVTLEDVIANSKPVRGAEDAFIDSLIRTATDEVERVSWRALVTQQLELRLDDWPRGRVLTIPRPPLQTIDSIAYTKADGTTGTLSASAYVVDTASEPGRVALKDDYDWPADDLAPIAGIRVTFTAGYGDAAADVPERFRRGIAMLTGFMHENRELPVEAAAAALGLGSIIGDRVRATYGED